MPIFNFNKKKSPAELVEEGISFARDLFGEHNLYFKQEEYVPPPTSHAPSGMRLVTVSGSKEAAESGDYFKFLIGFHGENPYIYEKETYQQTTPGFLPVNEPAKETRFKYYPFTPGKNPSVVLNPIQHIFALAAGTVLGRPVRVNDIRELSEKNLEGRWRQVKEGAVEISSYEGRPVVISGLPYAIKLGESSAKELADLMAGGPVIGLQNVRKDVFNAEGMAEERTRIDASAGRIPGLPREVYGLDTISKTHRLLRSVSVGFQNEDDTISSLTNTPTKAAQIGKRPYNPAMIFTRNKAYDVPESGNYRLQTAVMERGDPVGKQLVMNTLVPTVGGEGSRASGSSHFQAPTELLKTVRGFGPRAALEATFRSTIDLPIEGLSGPEDLFYTTKG
ncbi:MAG: hypothetical protein LLF94_11020, partial [Chlamydiales bacterium]|nr:hypothetical protein [Chlamydiales bacterium]